MRRSVYPTGAGWLVCRFKKKICGLEFASLFDNIVSTGLRFFGLRSKTSLFNANLFPQPFYFKCGAVHFLLFSRCRHDDG